MTKRVLTVFGTRPEGIKMMPVVRELRSRPGIEQIVCVTGQHRHMLDQVFTAFGEQPDIDLEIMAPNQTLADITSKVLQRMGAVLERTKPDIVLVHGDTTTAMAADLMTMDVPPPRSPVHFGPGFRNAGAASISAV